MPVAISWRAVMASMSHVCNVGTGKAINEASMLRSLDGDLGKI
jgi:hypothetical protein